MTNLTIQTQAAFERIEEALTGKTSDDLYELIESLKLMTKKAEEIREISNCLMTGDC